MPSQRRLWLVALVTVTACASSSPSPSSPSRSTVPTTPPTQPSYLGTYSLITMTAPQFEPLACYSSVDGSIADSASGVSGTLKLAQGTFALSLAYAQPICPPLGPTLPTGDSGSWTIVGDSVAFGGAWINGMGVAASSQDTLTVFLWIPNIYGQFLKDTGAE